MSMRSLFGTCHLSVCCLVWLALGVGVASAQDELGQDGFLSAPGAPSAAQPPRLDPQVEPEVTIIETDSEVIYEYRVRGRLYMVKVEPIVGPPFFLLDIDGDGILDVQDQRPPELAVPQWLLFSW